MVENFKLKIGSARRDEAVKKDTLARDENEKDAMTKDRGFRARKCGCACKVTCNCNCTCACRDHCMCKSPCEGECGIRMSQNLVLSIDGTSNQFGDKVSSWRHRGSENHPHFTQNTNVVKLHSRVLRDKQRKYYNCGIGTRVPDGTKAEWRQKIDNGLDQAFAL